MKITIEDIVKADLCVGCGACVSESKTSRMIWSDDGFLVPVLDDSFNGVAVKVCPFNPDPDKEIKDQDSFATSILKDAPHFHPRIGRYSKIYAGYVPKFRLSSSSGGFGTYFNEELLKRKLVDYVFTVVEINGTYAYDWFDNIEDIKKTSKTRYYPVTLERLFKEIDSKIGKIAVSAVPSFVKAIRLKQHYRPELKEKIVFVQGIICGGIKSRFFTDYLAQKSGISGTYSKQEYRIKDLESSALDYSFGAFDENNDFHCTKMRKVGNTWGTSLFNANAYDFSMDVTAELADVSLGDAWINPYQKDGAGNNVLICRSKIAKRIVEDGIREGKIKVEEIEIDTFLKSQAGGLRHKQIGMKYRLNRQRKKYGVTPYVYPPLLEPTPLEFKIVQRIRMNLRCKSLREWKKNPSSTEFERSITRDKFLLRISTKIYHKVQKIRKKLGLKSIKL